MKKFFAALTAIAFAVGLTLVGGAAPASAHNDGFDWNWHYADPTCTALTVTYPNDIPSGQANDVNVKIDYGTNYSHEVTLNFHNNSGTWSGTHVFTYSTNSSWPNDIGQYKVVWTQVGGTNYHWSGSVSCGSSPPTADASASITDNVASCASAETVSEGSIDHATWPAGGFTYTDSHTQFSIVATAASGHIFPAGTGVSGDGSTKTFTGHLSAKSTDCYSGYVIVAWSMPSWTDSTHPTWPQSYFTSQHESTPDLSALDSALALHCDAQFQIDIYNDSKITDDLIGGGFLLSSHNPNEDLITGTWGVAYKLVHSPACGSTPESGTATFTTQTCTSGSNTVTLSSVPGGSWTYTKNGGTSHSISSGTKHLSDLAGFGTYVFTLADNNAHDEYGVTAYTSDSWTPFDTSGAACAVVKTGTATFTTQTCTSGSNTVTLSSVPGGTWTYTKNGGSSHWISSGTKHLNDLDGFGTYVFRLADNNSNDGYLVTAYTSDSWTPFDASGDTCLVTETGTATFTTQTCDGGSNTVTLSSVPGGWWFYSKDGGASHWITSGTKHLSDLAGFGTYVFTLADNDSHDGYLVTAYTSDSWTPFDTSGAACAVTETGTATFTTQTCDSGSNSVTLSSVPGGSWSYTKDGGASVSITSGTKSVADLDGFGTYVFTLADTDSNDGYLVTAYTSASWTPFDTSGAACGVTETGTATFTTQSCDSGSNTVTLTSVPGGSWSYTKDGGSPAGISAGLKQLDNLAGFGTYVFTLTDTDSNDGYLVTAYTSASWTPFDASTFCVQVPTDPSSTDGVCTAGVDAGGSITVVVHEGIVYTITLGDANGPVVATIGADDSPTVSGLTGTDYTVSVTNLPGYTLVPGPTSWPITLVQPADCLVTPGASATPASCTDSVPSSVISGTIVLTVNSDVIYTVDSTDVAAGVGSVDVGFGDHTVTARLSATAPAGAVLSQSTWPTFTIDSVDCNVPLGVVASPNGSLCTSDATPGGATSWVFVDAVDHVTYTIFPGTDTSTGGTVLTDGFNAEPAGDYTVVATPDTGYTIEVGGVPTTGSESFAVTAEDSASAACSQLPPGATWHAGAKGSAAVCTSSSTQAGTITLLHGINFGSGQGTEPGEVKYTIQRVGSSVVHSVGSHVTHVSEAPGTYKVRATPVHSGDGISTDRVFTVTISAASVICSSLTSLAFTGTAGAVGVMLAGGMLFLGLAGIFMRRRFGRTAE